MSRSRVSSAQLAPLAMTAGGSSSTAGARAAAAWLRARGEAPPAITRWHAEIALDVIHERAPSEFDEATATRFHLDIYGEEWGVFLCHAGRASWIRVTDVAFIHGRDDFKLLEHIPPLRDVGVLLRRFEHDHHVRFQRQHAAVVTNVPNLEPAIRRWIALL